MDRTDLNCLNSVAVATRRPAATAFARRAWRLRARFADHDVAALEVCAVEGADRPFRLFVGAHLDEAKTLGASGEFVGDDPRADHRPMLREMLLEPFLRHGIGKVPNV